MVLEIETKGNCFKWLLLGFDTEEANVEGTRVVFRCFSDCVALFISISCIREDCNEIL